MFTVHIDDSGSDPKQLVANATALIIPGRRIPALQIEWDNLKGKYGFSCFHMSEFSARNGEHEPNFAAWDEDTRNKVFERVRSICKKYGVLPMSKTVYKKDYDEVVPEIIRKRAGMFHYTWAIRSLITRLRLWRREFSPDHPLEYMFDYMGEAKRNQRRKEIEDLMDQAEDAASRRGESGEFTNWGFRRRCDIPGLQCVDVIAWAIYQHGLLAFTRKPPHADAVTTWNDFSKYRGGRWGFDTTVTRDNLQKWVDAELEDGASLKAFDEWEGRKKIRDEVKRAKS